MTPTPDALRALVAELRAEAAIRNRKADEAFDKGDLLVAGYNRGLGTADKEAADRIESLIPTPPGASDDR
jgi:hypothetical protein